MQNASPGSRPRYKKSSFWLGQGWIKCYDELIVNSSLLVIVLEGNSKFQTVKTEI